MWPSLEVFFWTGLTIVFYTYLGYGIFLYLFIRIKDFFNPQSPLEPLSDFPEVTLLIAAYNEEAVVDSKMQNCRSLTYPADKLHILWITDGSDDYTDERLAQYPEIEVLHQPLRQGKTAALNRAMQFVKTPYTVFTDANTMLNAEALQEILKPFQHPLVGCVAGEKRIAMGTHANATTGGEGFYWKYESKLKTWDARLYTTVGAAGELYAIRTDLFGPLPSDTLLDDFILSMNITRQGYRIAYCDTAYAIESGSADMANEEKRKVRIAAGGIQAIWRLRGLLFPFPLWQIPLWFQYISHRVLRWSVTPVVLFLLFPVNFFLAYHHPHSIYTFLLGLQILFYLLGITGAYLQNRQIRTKILFIPYYFLFMNWNVIKGFFYLYRHQGKGTWQKAKRA